MDEQEERHLHFQGGRRGKERRKGEEEKKEEKEEKVIEMKYHNPLGSKIGVKKIENISVIEVTL